MDAIDRARWSEASCFGRSSGALAAPGSGTRHCLVTAASTSMLHHCPLDTSSTTDRHRRLTRHCLGRRLGRHLATAASRHRPLSPPSSTSRHHLCYLAAEGSKRCLAATRMILGRPLYRRPEVRLSLASKPPDVYIRPLRPRTPHIGLETYKKYRCIATTQFLIRSRCRAVSVRYPPPCPPAPASRSSPRPPRGITWRQ